MPVTYQIDREAKLIRTRCAGKVTFDDVVEHFVELGQEPSLPGRLDLLLDLAEAETPPDGGQVKGLADRMSGIRSNLEWGLCAIVAGRDALFGIGRMFSVYAESNFAESRVFRDLDEAEAWLASMRSGAGPAS